MNKYLRKYTLFSYFQLIISFVVNCVAEFQTKTRKRYCERSTFLFGCPLCTKKTRKNQPFAWLFKDKVNEKTVLFLTIPYFRFRFIKMEVYCSVSCVLIRLIVSLLLCSYACGNLFQEVPACPSSEEKWRIRAQKKQCKEPIPDFMCAAIENQPGRFGEICTIVGLTGKGECVVLDADTYNLNFVKCYESPGCPSNAYLSSDLYKYKACYNYSRETTASTFGTEQDKQMPTNPEKTEGDRSVHAMIIAIPTFITFLSVLFVLLVLWIKRISKLQNGMEHNEADEPTLLLNSDFKSEAAQKLSLLGGYLKFQLVKLSKVKNLRFHMVTHSESLKLHFKDNFDRMLDSVSVDWTKFDLDTVYKLLTNFCGIPSPGRGWGYKPADDDFSLGADIERIRILVNDILDDKTFKMERADQILERWKWIEKEFNPRAIIDFDHETKINYKKLKPNNDVEHGTVVTRAIVNILEKLKSNRIVTCRGAIGCGKTTALEYVTRKYEDEGWAIEWVEEFIDGSFLNSLIKRDSERILICFDNLFGSFGCQVFSDKIFDYFHYFMRSILIHYKNIKVLLGIHEHVFEEISSKNSLAWQDYNVFVEVNSLSQSEALLIYMMQHQKSVLKQEYIPFDDFLEAIENRSSLVGTPFQTLMISADPDVFSAKAFCNQPFQQLIEHFSKLFCRDEEMFYSLLYFMCVGIFNKRESDLNRDTSNAICDRLDKNTIEHYLPQLKSYIQIDGDTVEIKHDVIAIALFHTFMKQSKKPWSIFQACDIRGILELIRPANHCGKLHRFAVPLSREMINEAQKVLQTKIAHAKVDITDHPLSEYLF